MLRQATLAFLLSLAGYFVYKCWATYPDLLPNERARRRIARIARRRGISYQAAYRQWADQRLSWTRYRDLVRRA
jgi:hypothetical protein